MLLQEATPSERAIYLTFLLATGQALTAEEAAALVDVPVRTARRTLDRIARVAPVYMDEETGLWAALEEDGPVRISPL